MSSNQSHGEYPDCRSERESGAEASLLVSPLVVAGIVIGLVLFLSCITIIVGSLRKDSRLRNPHLRASYGKNTRTHVLVTLSVRSLTSDLMAFMIFMTIYMIDFRNENVEIIFVF